MAQFSSRMLARLFAGLSPEARSAVAVSGGGDSMALLLLLLNWHGGPHGIVALTVDHGLRDGSAAEARQVKRWCQDLGVEHHTLTWRHPPLTSGLQAKARAARHALLAGWCRKHGVATLLTAHTLEDQAETVAMRLKRTQSPRALAAIWPENEVDGVRLLRPLLGVKRQELRAYLMAQKQAWLEDPSNSNDAFERARLRKAAPSPALARKAEAARRKVEALDAKAHAWCARHAALSPSGMVSLPRAAFARLSPALTDAVLLRLTALAGGSPAEAARRHSLAAWLQARHEEKEQPRRTLGGAVFARRKRLLIASREAARIRHDAAVALGRKPVIWDGRYEVSGPKGSTIILASTLKALKGKDDVPDFVAASWPLVVRGDDVLATPLQQFHPAAKITFIKK